jgi:hypothetical protein
MGGCPQLPSPNESVPSPCINPWLMVRTFCFSCGHCRPLAATDKTVRASTDHSWTLKITASSTTAVKGVLTTGGGQRKWRVSRQLTPTNVREKKDVGSFAHRGGPFAKHSSPAARFQAYPQGSPVPHPHSAQPMNTLGSSLLST